MSRILLNVDVQPKIFTIAGQKPTIPDPVSAIPTDTAWKGTDIMIGEVAYNSSDDKYYYRDSNGVIQELINVSNFETNFKAYITDSTIQTLTDGASITVDHDNWGGRIFFLSTAQATPTMNISNFGKGGHISVKKTISGDTTVTIQGTGYKFVNMDTKALPAASVDITLSDTVDFGFEISLFHAGYTDGGSTVINVKKG